MTERKVSENMNQNEPKRTPTEQDVLLYVSNPENAEDIQYGRICGDGRNLETRGRISRFGADGGYVMGLLSLNRSHNLGLSVRQIVDATVRTSIVDGTKFSVHTDTHAGDGPSDIGCGHLAKAALPENEEKYGLPSDDVKEMITYIKKLAIDNPEHVEIITLEGEHRERGVIFNVGKTKKIAHTNEEDQFFVVAEGRDRKYVQEVLYPRLINELPQLGNIEVAEYLEVLRKQTMATASILAKGLPVFEVNLDGETPEVKYAGIVE